VSPKPMGLGEIYIEEELRQKIKNT